METIADSRANGQEGIWFDLSRHFDAPRRLAFAAWTDPAHARRWFAPEGCEMTEGTADFREGGAWRCELTGEDGVGLSLEGEYLEIVPGRRIAFSYRGVEADGARTSGRRIEVTLTDEGAGCRLSLRMGPFAAPSDRDRYRFGWAATLGRLDDYLPAMMAAEPAPATEPVIRLVRSFAQPPARVWRAWADPGLLARWWAPEGFAATTHAFGFEEGGLWHFTLRGPDGIGYPNRIRFLAFDPPRRLAYRHEGEDEAEDAVFESEAVLAETRGGGARLTLTMRFASVEVRDNVARAYGTVEGGRRMLARLAALVEGRGGERA